MGNTCSKNSEKIGFCHSESLTVPSNWSNNWSKPVTYTLQSAVESVQFDDETMEAPWKSTDSLSLYGDSTVGAESLSQVVKFKIGSRVLCMSWNLHHEYGSTPFDHYWNIWKVDLLKEDRNLIAFVWDVAEVFFNLDSPSELSRMTALASVVPSFLLSPETLEKYCTATNLSNSEREKVMQLSSGSIHDFLMAFSTRDYIFTKEGNIMKTRRLRTSSPLQPIYDPAAFQQLVGEDASLLPALLLDSLHLVAIQFTMFVISLKLMCDFSECDPGDQIALLSNFTARRRPGRLSIPRDFKEMKARVYEKWSKMFEDESIIQQIWSKAFGSDILLLQRVREGTFNEIVRQFSGVYNIVPAEFPAGEEDTTIICLLKSKVELQTCKKIRNIDPRHFTVVCKTGDISYYVGVVSLTNGEDAETKRKMVTKLMRPIGSTAPVIFGGDFGEDLAASGNSVAKAMLENYNGINHEQKTPLRTMMKRTRTYLHADLEKAGKPFTSVTNGIFSTLPLVQDAFTSFNGWCNNPCDHAPIFQEILLGLF